MERQKSDDSILEKCGTSKDRGCEGNIASASGKKCGLISALFAYDISGPSFDFVIDSGNIVSDNAEADHQHTSYYQLQQNNGGKTFKRCSGKITVQGLHSEDQGKQ